MEIERYLVAVAIIVGVGVWFTSRTAKSINAAIKTKYGTSTITAKDKPKAAGK